MQMEMEELKSADVITAGFPCQDISHAGKRAGLQGERSGLWWQARRAIRMVRPRFALLENVAALLNRGMGSVLGGLARIGYDTEWYCIPASTVGAPHERKRVWILAYPNGSRVESLDISQSIRPYTKESCGRKLARAIDAAIPADDYARDRGNYDDVPVVMDRLKALGNAVVPDIPEIFGNAIKLSN